MEEEFLTVADVASLLKLNQQTVRNWIEQGRLPALRVGRRVRVRRSDLEVMVEQGSTSTRPPDRAARRRLASASGAVAEAADGGSGDALVAALFELSEVALALAEELRG